MMIKLRSNSVETAVQLNASTQKGSGSCFKQVVAFHMSDSQNGSPKPLSKPNGPIVRIGRGHCYQ